MMLEKLQPYLSEQALIEYMALVETALIAGFVDESICHQDVLTSVKNAASVITAAEVYDEEKRNHHLARAFVSCLGKHISEDQRRFIHLGATSHDIICTAEAMRYQEFTKKILLPKLLQLEKILIHLAIREKDTVQIGRTHGQHAVPVTFGFTIAEYIARIGERIRAITKSAIRLRGQLSGAVGAYNAHSLFITDPLAFEKKVLGKLGLRPGYHSTQIVAPEFLVDYVHTLIATFSVLANLADDMRHLQRTEISEVGEYYSDAQVGSSTMPHKKNPITFESVKSLYKAIMPRMITLYLDQCSEHQRDLTNSASSRFTSEIVATFYIATYRMCDVMQLLIIDKEAIRQNLSMSKEKIIAEPLYILLSLYGCPDAHKRIRELTNYSQQQNKALVDVVFDNAELQPYIVKFTEDQKQLLRHPEKYLGKAVEKTEYVCEKWKHELGL